MVRTRSKPASSHLKPPEIAMFQSPTTPLSSSSTSIVPSSLKSVLLFDWWLVKADGQSLAVGGFSSRKQAGLRLFYSAAISRRHEATILEASDGIIVTVSGFINRSRTHENGFPPRVYNHFLLGFPFNWQDYVGSSSDEKSVSQGGEASTSHFSHKSKVRNLEPDLDDFAVTRLRDLLLSTYGESSNSIFTRSSESKSSSPMENVESTLLETPKSCQKVNSCQDIKKHDSQDCQKNNFVVDRLEAVEEAKSKMDMDIQVPVRGVSTRSMTKSGNSKNKSEEPLLSDSQRRQRCEENNSLCENSDNKRGQTVRSSSIVSSTINNSVRADKEVDANAGKSEGRRSSLRLRNRKQNQVINSNKC